MQWHQKKFDMGSPCISFLIFLGYHLQDQSLFQKKKLTGVPIDMASLLLLEGQIPWLPHKKFLPPPKKQKVPLFPPPYLKLLGTNHANDIFYIYKLKTQWFFLHIFYEESNIQKNKQYQPFYHYPIWKNRKLIKISKIFIMIQSMDVWFD